MASTSKGPAKPRSKPGPKPTKFTAAQLALVDEAAELGASLREIAALIGVSHQTVSRHLGPRVSKKDNEGKIVLRRLQQAAAQQGNPTMLIWLGKNRLGQTDQPRPDDKEDTDAPIRVRLVESKTGETQSE